jgi:hypothetical protein
MRSRVCGRGRGEIAGDGEIKVYTIGRTSAAG